MWHEPILFFKGIFTYNLPMLELFEVDGGDKIYGLTGTGSLGLIKSIMSGGDSGCFCGKAISLLLLLLWFQYLWHWLSTNYFSAGKGNSLTHTYTKNFPFFREIEKTYMAYILMREVLVTAAAGWLYIFPSERIFRSPFLDLKPGPRKR